MDENSSKKSVSEFSYYEEESKEESKEESSIINPSNLNKEKNVNVK